MTDYTKQLAKQATLTAAMAHSVLDPSTIVSDREAADAARAALLAAKFSEQPNNMSAITDGASVRGF